MVYFQGIQINFAAQNLNFRQSDPNGAVFFLPGDVRKIQPGFDDHIIAVDILALGKGNAYTE